MVCLCDEVPKKVLQLPWCDAEEVQQYFSSWQLIAFLEFLAGSRSVLLVPQHLLSLSHYFTPICTYFTLRIKRKELLNGGDIPEFTPVMVISISI